jgi:hypothetical protein
MCDWQPQNQILLPLHAEARAEQGMAVHRVRFNDGSHKDRSIEQDFHLLVPATILLSRSLQ